LKKLIFNEKHCSEEQGEINVQMARRELVELFPGKIYVKFIALPFSFVG
jgi:hypothetical protein